MKTFFLATCLWLNVLSIGWGQPSEEVGQISGIITDVNAARVANAKISVTGNEGTQVFSSDGEGAYQIPLKSGIYTITISSAGFCPVSHPSFKIEKGTKATFDFTLIVCPLVHRMIYEQGKYTGETANYEAPYKEDRHSIKSSTSRSFDLLIRFGAREQDKGRIKYLGYQTETQLSRQIDTQKLPVMVRFDLLTIEADEILYDEKLLELEAKGRVKVQNADRYWEKDSLTLKFKNGRAEIQDQK